MRSGYLLALAGYAVAVPLFTFTGFPTGVPTGYATGYPTGISSGYATGIPASYPTDGPTYHEVQRHNFGGPRHSHYFGNSTGYPVGPTATPLPTGYATGSPVPSLTFPSHPTGFSSP